MLDNVGCRMPSTYQALTSFFSTVTDFLTKILTLLVMYKIMVTKKERKSIKMDLVYHVINDG